MIPASLRTFGLGGMGVATLFGAQATALEVSTFLPERGAGAIDVVYAQLGYEEFTIGETVTRPGVEFDQRGVVARIEYGLTDRIAIDLETGWAEADFFESDEGLLDTRLGVRVSVLDETRGHPVNLALRAAAIIPGTYEAGGPTALGDGAGGGELAVGVARSFMNGLVLQGTLGGRARGEGAPEEVYGGASAHYAVHERVTLGVGLQRVEALGGVDIGGPGFSPNAFQETEEDFSRWYVSAGVGLTARVSAFAGYGEKFATRNSGISNDFQIGVKIGF